MSGLITIRAQDLWDAQQAAADAAAEALDRHYEGRDWTGRAVQYERALDACYEATHGSTVGPLPGGETIRVEVGR